MNRRRQGIWIGALLAVLVFATAAGATGPVVIHKTKTDHRKRSYASDLCAVGVVKEGAIYETEGCHRGTPLAELLKFQVRAARGTPLKLAGSITAESCRRCRLDLKLVLSVDGKRIRTSGIHVRSGKPEEFPIQRLTSLPKGTHMVELGIQAVEEEGLSGLAIDSSELRADTP